MCKYTHTTVPFMETYAHVLMQLIYTNAGRNKCPLKAFKLIMNWQVAIIYPWPNCKLHLLEIHKYAMHV